MIIVDNIQLTLDTISGKKYNSENKTANCCRDHDLTNLENLYSYYIISEYLTNLTNQTNDKLFAPLYTTDNTSVIDYCSL